MILGRLIPLTLIAFVPPDSGTSQCTSVLILRAGQLDGIIWNEGTIDQWALCTTKSGDTISS